MNICAKFLTNILMLALFPAKMKIYFKICDLFQSNDEKAVIEIFVFCSLFWVL